MLSGDLKRVADEDMSPAANQNRNAISPLREIVTNKRDGVLEMPMQCAGIKPLWLMEKEAIMEALYYTGQDITRAASMLEVSPATLYRKLQVWRTAAATQTAVEAVGA